MRRPAGLNSYSPLVLEMGSTFDTSLWDWRRKVKREGAQRNRKSISIIQQNEKREEVKRWRVRRPPRRLTGTADKHRVTLWGDPA